MIQLELAKEKDINELTVIKKRAFSREFELYGFVPEEMITRMWHEKMLVESIYYKIVLNDIIIGGVNIFKGDENDCYLCSLFIDAENQNKGIGSQVIELLEAKQLDCNKWMLETPAMSGANCHFYEKAGYIHVDDYTPAGAPKGFSLRVYEKRI